MKKLLSQITKRAFPVSALCIVLIGAILYQSGLFELPFIVRSDFYLQEGDSTPTPTPTTPIFSNGALESPDVWIDSDSVLDSINTSTNISGITTSTKPQTKPDSSTNNKDDNLPLGGLYQNFSSISKYKGYKVSYTDYSKSSVLAEISLAEYEITPSLYGGSKIKVEFTSVKDNADGIPYSKREFSADTAMAVELYMGYIIVDNGTSVALFSSTGSKLGTYERLYFVPAYTRDSDNNPLFYISSEGFGKYYRFNEATKKFTQATYNDEDENRGLYYDYTPDWGVSDNGYKKYDALVSCIVEMTPVEAFDYTDVATLPPEPETTPAPAPDVSVPSDSSSQAPVSNAAASSSAEILAREPRTEILAGYGTAQDFLARSHFGASTEKYSNYTVSEDGKTVFVEIMERRWAFGRSNYLDSDEYKNSPDDKKLSEIFKYNRIYNFQSGLCATVDRDGVLSYTNTSGKNIIHRDQEYYGQNGRKLLSSYAEPVLKGIDSVGSLYFDRGYVLIRQIDIDFQFTDKMSGDYTYLVNQRGLHFSVPAGYKIRAYSDGVLLLEKNGYFGYYSTSGKWIAQPIYTYARPFAEGLGVIGFSASKKGVVDTDGNIIVPFKYDYISQVSSGVMALYESNSGWKIVAKLEK